MQTRTYDMAALFARIGVGMVFTAHGWEKIRDGIDQTTQSYHGMRIPFPVVIAVYSTFVELLGGLMLILGLALPIAGALLFLDMIASIVLIHADAGVFMGSDPAAGLELSVVLGLVSLVFACGGGGRATVDRVLFPRRPAHRRTETRGHVRTLTDGRTAPGEAGARESDAGHDELDDPSPNWVSELKDDSATGYGRSPFGAVDPSPPASESKDDPASDVLVAGKKPGRRSTPGKSTSARTRKPSPGKSSGSSRSKGKPGGS